MSGLARRSLSSGSGGGCMERVGAEPRFPGASLGIYGRFMRTRHRSRCQGIAVPPGIEPALWRLCTSIFRDMSGNAKSTQSGMFEAVAHWNQRAELRKSALSSLCSDDQVRLQCEVYHCIAHVSHYTEMIPDINSTWMVKSKISQRHWPLQPPKMY